MYFRKEYYFISISSITPSNIYRKAIELFMDIVGITSLQQQFVIIIFGHFYKYRCQPLIRDDG